MFNRTNVFILIAAALAACLGYALQRHGVPFTQPSGVNVLRVGDPYADLSLPNLEGQALALSTWADRPRLLNFWASWCAPCVAEMPVLDRFAQMQASQGVRVIGIALDEAPNVRQFLTQHPVSYPVLLDTPSRQDSSVRYGNVRGVLPYSVLIGADGRILAQKWGAFEPDALEDWVNQHLQR